jgi:hypothetical protein
MPINSAMCSIDKSVSLIEAINIFISEGVDELLVWDESESRWVWMLTVADIVRFLLYAFKCITHQQPISTLPSTQTSSTSKSARRRPSPKSASTHLLTQSTAR